MGKRAGLLPTDALPQSIRAVLEPLVDVVARVTSANNRDNRMPLLPAEATLADVIARLNQVITRIQED